MIYDSDLKLRRRITAALVGMNCTLTAINLWEHHWIIAATTACWTATCAWDLALIKWQQCFRDMARIVQAGVRAIEERSRR